MMSTCKCHQLVALLFSQWILYGCLMHEMNECKNTISKAKERMKHMIESTPVFHLCDCDHEFKINRYFFRGFIRSPFIRSSTQWNLFLAFVKNQFICKFLSFFLETFNWIAKINFMWKLKSCVCVCVCTRIVMHIFAFSLRFVCF